MIVIYLNRFFSLKRVINFFLLFVFFVLSLKYANAAGVVPETSVVLINTADGEGVIAVKNTDEKAVLLYTSIQNLPEDKENIIIVTQPVARVEAGERHLVRFILQSSSPITTQRLKRVTFEGIPQKDPNNPSMVGVNVRQNLPVLIKPSSLSVIRDPWTLINWSIEGNKLIARNDSPYVIRLHTAVDLFPASIRLSLSNTYLLPGKEDSIDMPYTASIEEISKIRIYPVSEYGYEVPHYEAEINRTIR